MMTVQTLPKKQTTHHDNHRELVQFLSMTINNMRSKTIKAEKIDNVQLIMADPINIKWMFAVYTDKEFFPIVLQLSESGKSLMMDSPKISPDLLIAMYNQIEDYLDHKYHHRLGKLKDSAHAERVKKWKNEDLDRILTDRFIQFVTLRIKDVESFLRIVPEQQVLHLVNELEEMHKKVGMSFTMHLYSNKNVKDYLEKLRATLIYWTNYTLANCVELSQGDPFTSVKDFVQKLDEIKGNVIRALEVTNK